ncbi:unnamed protein product [Anisakis simplex]|uniref:Uncharacterized protein n=1 Tax=Anisakis simplex TaxID=6269 RepID=A0A0M3KFT3_ANISI|nr:unnamed protein product [Anisakis simplex]
MISTFWKRPTAHHLEIASSSGEQATMRKNCMQIQTDELLEKILELIYEVGRDFKNVNSDLYIAEIRGIHILDDWVCIWQHNRHDDYAVTHD